MTITLSCDVRIAANPTDVLRVIKDLTWQHLGETDPQRIMVNEGRELLAATPRTAFREPVAAFMEKRQPDFHKLD